MSLTTVTYKSSTKQRLDMRWLSQAINESINCDAVKNQPLQIGNEESNVGEFFDITGNFSNQPITLENSNQSMDYLGHALKKKTELTVNGDAGHFAGAKLAGGKLVVKGNAQNYAGCGMSKGQIEITGNANDYLGGAFAGDKKGMSGGTILVHGNSGNFTGDLLRRGTIMVVGNIGDYCASRMIAGTITNLGTIGKQVGVGMRRGTILLPHKPKDVLTGFHDCGRHNLGYLTLLLHELRQYKSTFQSLHPMRRRVQRYIGDTTVGGQGEMLIWIG
ncbi:MAG: formylmethanofuran dehydrogenase subunit C [Gammaproteobacteria bacterium]|nr:MAG: formylmethanofuran dehydrogenase subunit C [Gammaproteobacteria bacterium]